MTRPLFRLPLVLAACLIVLPASAQWYVGASAGSTRASFKGTSAMDQFLDLGFLDASTRTDEKDAMYRLHAGWRFHRFAALELAYVDLGRYSIRSEVSPPGTLDASIKSDGGELSLVGMWPVWDRLSLLGRVGAFAARTRAHYTGSGSVQIIDGRGEQTRHSTHAVYGLGAMYDITPKLAVRGEWSRYDKLGSDLTGGEFDVRAWSLGVQWRF